MSDDNFSIDLKKLKITSKEVSTNILSTSDKVAEAHGFIDREPSKKRGRQPSPRTGQIHARVLPDISDEIANEAKRRGVQQGVIIEDSWRLYQEKNGKLLLIPDNPDYPPIELNEGSEMIIWGVVTNVIHAV